MRRLIILVTFIIGAVKGLNAQEKPFPGIIPAPAKMNIGTGSYTIPAKIGVQYTGVANADNFNKLLKELPFIDVN